jgi:hypothetical protein
MTFDITNSPSPANPMPPAGQRRRRREHHKTPRWPASLDRRLGIE